MFGRHDWFTFAAGGRRLRPRTWQGWAYLAAWGGVVGAPAWLFATRGQWPELLVWCAVAGVAWKRDWRRLRGASDEPLDVREVFVIDDRGARMERAA